MTPDELDAALAQLIASQLKPRSTQNSHRRKCWENLRIWRVCTLGKSCKLGAYKQRVVDGGSWNGAEDFYLHSYYRGISGIFRWERHDYFVEFSYHKKFVRQWANRRVRRYKGEVADHSFYRKIFDYEWECW